MVDDAAPNRAVQPCPPAAEVCLLEGGGHHPSHPGSGLNSTASCVLKGPCLQSTIEQLPTRLVSLTVTVDRFPTGGNESFSRFATLRELAILWQYDSGALPGAQQTALSSPALFAGLRMLQRLRISIPVSSMLDTLLADLDSLRELDFSNIGFFSTAKFAALFNGSRLGEKPLETVILKRISGVGTARDRQFLLRELFPLFRGLNIRALDMSDNGVLYLYPGMTQYLPYLQDITLHGTVHFTKY